MDFNSLGENSPIYIVRKKPFQYLTGVLKSKTSKQQNPYIPQTSSQPIDVVVNVNGSDEVVPNIPQGMEAVEYRGCYYCTTLECAQQAISGLIQLGKSGIAEQPYYNSLVKEGEATMELINPQYAEGKRQARSIKSLEERQTETDKKLDAILSRLDEVLSPKK